MLSSVPSSAKTMASATLPPGCPTTASKSFAKDDEDVAMILIEFKYPDGVIATTETKANDEAREDEAAKRKVEERNEREIVVNNKGRAVAAAGEEPALPSISNDTTLQPRSQRPQRAAVLRTIERKIEKEREDAERYCAGRKRKRTEHSPPVTRKRINRNAYPSPPPFSRNGSYPKINGIKFGINIVEDDQPEDPEKMRKFLRSYIKTNKPPTEDKRPRILEGENSAGFSCESCHTLLKRKRDLQRHAKICQTTFRALQCMICGHRTDQMSNMESHVRSIHIGIPGSPCYCCKLEGCKYYSVNWHFFLKHHDHEDDNKEN